VISALDASVARFGPQTSQAALLEVEAMPILASPINGVWLSDDASGDEEGEGEDGEEVKAESDIKKKIRPLNNAEEVHGNVAVMTSTGTELSGVEMARIAQLSGAAALMVVNLDEDHPEDIYRLPADEDGAEDIQIPVVMISLNSANALTSATVTPETKPRDIVNNGMPDRVRLYAGGDRPFFEDVEPIDPTVYLIHNMLTGSECDSLIEQAKRKVRPVVRTKNDSLQLTHDASKFHNVQRVMLWQGMLKGPAAKGIEERIEQVTGFPASHFSDFVVDRLDEGSYWLPHVDSLLTKEGDDNPPLATITVFLSEHPEGGELVFPSAKGEPIKIRSVKGMAAVHHNTDEGGLLDVTSVHALLPVEASLSSGQQPLYVARKFIFSKPVSNARRVALPLFALPFGGRLPDSLVLFHDFMVRTFGRENGEVFFDKACVFLPALLMLCLAQSLAEYGYRKFKGSSSSAASDTKSKKPGQRPKTATDEDGGGTDNNSTSRRTKKKKN